MNERNILDLQLINWLAKKDHARKSFCYAVKDILLRNFATPDGYDLQVFTKEEWGWGDDGPTGDTYSWHYHILERFKIGDRTFHRPSDEFRYEDIRGRQKQSARYEEFKALCRSEVDGKNQPPEFFDRMEARLALRRLVHEFFALLRSSIEKPVRTHFPNFKTLYWFKDHFDGYKVRIPSAVVSCSGCGCRMTAYLDTYDCRLDDETGELNIQRERFTKWLRVRCDSAWNYYPDCAERTKDFRHGMDNTRERAWVWERELAAKYIRDIYEEFYSSVEAEPLRKCLAERAEQKAALTEPAEV